jgi:hypothetical protein
MLNMTENSCINMAMNSTNVFLVNPEAHTSLQLLHRRSSDEDDGDDDEEEEETEEDEQDEKLEDEKDEEIEDIEEENGDDTLIEELNNDHKNHSIPSPPLPFPVGWGRGSRLLSMVILFNFFS